MSGKGPQETVAVVGAGIVGVCCALFLLRDGHRVILVDRGDPGEGASFGNASIVTEASVLPVAKPGILKDLPKMLLDPKGPLAIRWRYLPGLLPWLMQFIAAARPDRVAEISPALATLGEGVIDAYGPLLEMAGEPEILKRTGWLSVFESEAGFEKFAPSLEAMHRYGVKLDLLEAEEIRQVEPKLAPIFAKGVFLKDVAYCINSFRLVQVLAAAFQREGGELRRASVAGFDIGPDGPCALQSDQGDIAFDRVVIAAGAWSRDLAKRLGSKVPLDTERGYHLTIPNGDDMPRMPIYSTERAFAATPLEHGLRVAGTVELGGLDAPPNWERVEVLRHHIQRWYPHIDTNEASTWLGFRPSMPDSLPVIGQAPRFSNAYFAFGHGHLGLSQGAKTGKAIADLVASRDPGFDLRPYRADRF